MTNLVTNPDGTPRLLYGLEAQEAKVGAAFEFLDEMDRDPEAARDISPSMLEHWWSVDLGPAVEPEPDMDHIPDGVAVVRDGDRMLRLERHTLTCVGKRDGACFTDTLEAVWHETYGGEMWHDDTEGAMPHTDAGCDHCHGDGCMSPTHRGASNACCVCGDWLPSAAPAVTATDAMLPAQGPAAAEGVVAIYTDGAHGPGWYYATGDRPAVTDAEVEAAMSGYLDVVAPLIPEGNPMDERMRRHLRAPMRAALEAAARAEATH